MKKILLVGNTSWGMYTFRKRIISHLSHQGYRVIVAAPHDSYTEKIEVLGVEVVNIPLESSGLNVFKDLKLFFALQKLYKLLKPDLTIHYTVKPNIYGSIVAVSQSIQTWSFVTGLGLVYISNGWLRRIVDTMYQFAFRGVENVIFLNEVDMSIFIKKRLIRPSQAYLMEGEGVDAAKFNLPINKKKGVFKFIYVGRVLKYKGIYDLISAIEKLQYTSMEFEVHILGENDQNHINHIVNSTIEDIDKMGNVHYHGYRENTLPFFEDAHALILPSYREGLSFSIMEAMACRRPVIGTNVPGINTIVEDGINGFLVPVRNPEALCQAMKKMIELPDETYCSLAMQARKTIEDKYDINRIISHYDTLLNQQFQDTELYT